MQVNWHNVYKALSSAWHLVGTSLVTVLLKERRHVLKQVDWQRGIRRRVRVVTMVLSSLWTTASETSLPKASGLAGRVRYVRARE